MTFISFNPGTMADLIANMRDLGDSVDMSGKKYETPVPLTSIRSPGSRSPPIPRGRPGIWIAWASAPWLFTSRPSFSVPAVTRSWR